MADDLDFKLSTKNILKFTFPNIASTICINIYGLVDTICVSRFINEEALAACMIVFPLMSIALAMGFMIATGGIALVAKQLGEGETQKARENFSLFVLFCIGISLALCTVALLFRQNILMAMGATPSLYPLCELYAVPIFLVIPFAMSGFVMHMFLVGAGKPKLAFALSLIGGGLNIAMDVVFLGVFQWGIASAGWASCLGYVVQGMIAACYFAFNQKGMLRFVRPHWNGRAILKACSNGMSEMVGVLSSSITQVTMNIILMSTVGKDGVAAAAVVMGELGILTSTCAGYNQGISPVVSYHYGKKDLDSLKLLFKKSILILLVLSVLTVAASFSVAHPFTLIFTDADNPVFSMAVNGIHLISISFLLLGVNLFGSSLFTALNDGKTSAFLALSHSLVFLMACLLILPRLLGLNGIWLAFPCAEVLSIIVTAVILIKKRALYHYL